MTIPIEEEANVRVLDRKGVSTAPRQCSVQRLHGRDDGILRGGRSLMGMGAAEVEMKQSDRIVTQRCE